MLFMVLVIGPYIRKLPIRDKMFQDIGKRYQGVGTFVVLPLLFITGLVNIHFITGISTIFKGLDNPYTRTLLLKIGIYFIVVLLTLIHDLYTGPRSVNNPKIRRLSRVIGILNMLLSIYMVYLASRLRFGG